MLNRAILECGLRIIEEGGYSSLSSSPTEANNILKKLQRVNIPPISSLNGYAVNEPTSNVHRIQHGVLYALYGYFIDKAGFVIVDKFYKYKARLDKTVGPTELFH